MLFKKTKITRTSLVAALVVAGGAVGLFAAAPLAHAAASTRYVSTSGNDTSDCTQVSTPCATIQYAIDQAQAGDTVSVAAGTYTEMFTADKALTLIGAQTGNDARTRSGAETILKTPAGQNFTAKVNTNDVTIDGFTIDGSTGTSSLGIDLVGPTSQNVHITNNIVKHTKVAVDAIFTDVSGFRASQNLFDANNMTGSADGVYLASDTGSDIEVSNNTFRNTDDGSGGANAAVNLQGTTAGSLSNVRVLNNSSSNDGTFLVIFLAHDVAVTGNTATGESGSTVLIDLGVDNLSLKNNTLTNGVVGVKFSSSLSPGGAPTANVTMTGNVVSGMSQAAVVIQPGAIGSGISITDNNFSNNKADIDNQGTVAVAAARNSAAAAGANGAAGQTNGIKTPTSINTGGGWGAHGLSRVVVASIAVLVFGVAALIATRKQLVAQLLKR